MSRKIFLAAVSIAVAAALAALQQRRQPPDALTADRAARTQEYMKHYTTAPGGTPEENLWQVLVLFGVGDKEPASWNGSLASSGGELHAVEGYRFEPPDRLLPEGGWRLQTKVERILAGSALSGHGSGVSEQRLLPKGLLVRGASPAKVSVKTDQGAFEFSPADIAFGSAERRIGRRVEIRRIPPATDLSGTELRQHDFPAIAAGAGGAVWVAWSSYHDRREELNFRRYREGRWTRLIPVGRASADLWRPQVATDGAGKPWLIWSQQRDGNWDIYAMSWEDNEWGGLYRLSDDPLPDIEPHAARGPDGAVYVVWQALSGHHSHVRMRYLREGKWSPLIHVTGAQHDDWEPAVAAGADGRVWIAWDRYTDSYDIYARSFTIAGGLGPEMPVASTARFEAYASVAVDGRNRPWIAWEVSGPNWGKDLGFALGPNAPGYPLGGPRRIEVVCLDGGSWKAPAAFSPSDSLAPGATGESRPLLFTDPQGGLWMAFKRRYARAAFRPSVHWESFLSRLEGGRWSEPILLPNSSARASTRMGLASAGGRLWAFWPTDSRNYAFASRPHANRVVAGSLPSATIASKSATSISASSAAICIATRNFRRTPAGLTTGRCKSSTAT